MKATLGAMKHLSTSYWYILIVLGGIGFVYLLPQGGIFLLDTIFIPGIEIDFSKPFLRQLSQFLTNTIGYQTRSKIFLYCMIVAIIRLGVLLSTLFQTRNHKHQRFVTIVAVAFGLRSPFFLERLFSQWNVLVMSICVGYVVYYFFVSFSRKLTVYECVYASLALSVGLMARPHIVFIVGVVGVVWLLFRHPTKTYLQWTIIGLFACICNINWILFGSLGSSMSDDVSSMDRNHVLAFQTTNLDNLGIELTVMLQYGMRAERHQHLLLPGDKYTYRYLGGIAILILSLIGVALSVYTKRNTREMLRLLLVGAAGLTLSVGVSSVVWGDRVRMMYEHIPGYYAMREPHKWTILFVLVCWVGLLYFLRQFVDQLYTIWSTSKIKLYLSLGSSIILFGLLLHLRSPHFPGSIKNTIVYTERPESYRDLSQYLQTNQELSKIVLIPWYSYLDCKRTEDKTTIVGVHSYLGDSRIVRANNIGVGEVISIDKRKEEEQVTAYLETGDIEILKEGGFDGAIVLNNCGYREHSDGIRRGSRRVRASEAVSVYQF